MMDVFREYLLTVIFAAIMCSLIKHFLGGKAATAPLIRILCGIFMACTLIRPVFNFDLSGIISEADSFSYEAEAAAYMGEVTAAKEVAAVIKSKTESYILDKAAAMEVDLDVEITLDALIPSGVVIRGAVAPYVKSTLSDWIVQQLGIPKEAQIWIGQR